MARTTKQIRESLSAAVREVRANRDLSAEGQQRQLARVYQHHNSEMQTLRQTVKDERERRYEQLHRKMFGNPTAGDPSSAINFRDAQERAESVKDADEARRLLARAHAAGDTALSKALAMRALEKAGEPTGTGWIPLINEWAMVNNVDDELTEISTLRTNPVVIMEYALPRPKEITDARDVDTLAKEAAVDDAQPTRAEQVADDFGWGRGEPETA